MEVTHLRDTVNARDMVIEEMRGKIKEYQRRLEEASINSSKVDTQAQKRVLSMEAECGKL